MPERRLTRIISRLDAHTLAPSARRAPASLCALFALVALCLTTSPVWALDIKMGVVTAPGSAQYVAAEQFKKLTEERSGGDIEVTLYHSGALGSETDMLQQLQLGGLDMAVITLGPFDAFVPEVKVVGFPFLFSGVEQVDEVLDGPLGEEVLARLASAGFEGLCFSENGFRHFTNDVRPVKNVDDVAGLKVRVMESELHKELWRTLGANPTPMGWPIYSELQQHTIDAQENPLWVISLYKLYEVQKYLSLTGHVYSAHIDVASKPWYDGLAVETQSLIRTTMRDAAAYQKTWTREREAAYLEELTAEGMQVLNEPDLATFRDRIKDMARSEMFSEPETQALLKKFLEATR